MAATDRKLLRSPVLGVEYGYLKGQPTESKHRQHHDKHLDYLKQNNVSGSTILQQRALMADILLLGPSCYLRNILVFE